MFNKNNNHLSYHLLCSFDQWKLRSTLACSVQLDDAVFFVMRLFQEQIFFELAVLLLHTVKLVCESLQHCFILSVFDISAGDMCQGLGISLGTHVGSPFANLTVNSTRMRTANHGSLQFDECLFPNRIAHIDTNRLSDFSPHVFGIECVCVQSKCFVCIT